MTLRFQDAGRELDGYVVVDSLLGGWCSGGLRYAPNVTPTMLAQLSRLMSLKYAIMEIPMGGAKAGLIARPGHDRLAVIERFGQLIEPLLRTGFMVGEDVGTGGDDVLHIFDSIDLDPLALVVEKARDRQVHIEIPPGLTAHDLMTPEFEGRVAGFGVVETLSAAAAMSGRDLAGLRVALQGFGSVGRATAERLVEVGATVVAVADVNGTLYSRDGLDVAALVGASDPAGSLDRAKLSERYERLAPPAWSEVSSEVLIPAAVEGALDASSVQRVHPDVRFLIEAANAPVQPDIERELEARDVLVVPDFVASAGAAAAFGVLMTGQAELENVWGEYTGRMAARTHAVLSSAAESGASAREAAIALAQQYIERRADEERAGEWRVRAR